MTPARFKLFSYWRTSATYRVRVALNLKNLTAEESNVDIDRGEHTAPDFLSINPMGAIPALLDREAPHPQEPLTQSMAILEYLEEICPSPALLPTKPFERARVRSLALMLTADTHPLITPRIKKYLVGGGHLDDAAWRAWQIKWFTTGLQAFEARLASDKLSGQFCHGNDVGLADICLASIIVVSRVFKIEVPDIPAVNAIMARCETLEAFASADPMRQAGAPPH